jgi:dolichyl-phosphate beta-glucosyltransferase
LHGGRCYICEECSMSKQIRPHMSLVIPAYNEANRLPSTLRQIEAHRETWKFPHEVVIVVEPSDDETLKLAEGARRFSDYINVLTYTRRRGKGYAVRSGALAARGELIFFTDADLSTPLEDLDRALQVFDEQPEVEVIVGNRQHPGSKILRRQSWFRERMGKVFNRLVQSLAGLRIGDTQCGFKGFRYQVAKEIFSRQRIDGFSFDVEVLLLAEAMGYKVAELPVHWSNSTSSHVRLVQDSLRMLRDTLSIRRRVKDTLREYPFYK